jgi:hypothetical protein
LSSIDVGIQWVTAFSNKKGAGQILVSVLKPGLGNHQKIVCLGVYPGVEMLETI